MKPFTNPDGDPTFLEDGWGVFSGIVIFAFSLLVYFFGKLFFFTKFGNRLAGWAVELSETA